jgi:hypothetical protein
MALESSLGLPKANERSPASENKTYRFCRFDWVRDSEFVVGDDPKGVARRGHQILVGQGVLLDGPALRPGFRLPLVLVCKLR